jgi:hypothetical protein
VSPLSPGWWSIGRVHCHRWARAPEIDATENIHQRLTQRCGRGQPAHQGDVALTVATEPDIVPIRDNRRGRLMANHDQCT